MAITVGGFDSADGVTEADWSALANSIGSRYTVLGPTDFQVTARPAASLTANIAPGTAFGCGVRVTSDSQITTNHSTVGSGTRWDAIVLRRNWSGTGGTASVVALTGTSARTVPAGRLNTPGTSDDQVLALVQITAGQSLFTQVVDMRWFPSKVVTVADLIAVTDPHIGLEAVVLGAGTADDTRWRYQLDPSGSAAWERDTTANALYSVTPDTTFLTSPTGWASAGMVVEAVKLGNIVNLYVEIRCGTDTAVDANGGVTDTYIGTVDSEYAPERDVPFSFTYRSSAATTYSGHGEIRAGGTVYVVSAQPNVPIAAQPFGTWSLKFNTTYFVRD